MKKAPFLLLGMLAALGSLNSCKRIQPVDSNLAVDAPAAIEKNRAASKVDARTALTQFLQQKPNAAVFQLDSAQFVDVDDHWQVMVPRTDWAGRMPNAAAFSVDKKTGQVTTLFVK